MAQVMEAWARKQADDTDTDEEDRAHVRQYADQVGISFEDALEKFGYVERDRKRAQREEEEEAKRPKPPEGFEFVWEWYFELAQSRQQTGFGVSPISWQEMDAWARITGVTLYPWLAMCFRAMDQAWLKVAAERSRKNGDKS